MVLRERARLYRDLILAFSFSAATRLAWMSEESVSKEHLSQRQEDSGPTFPFDGCFYTNTSEDNSGTRPLTQSQRMIVDDHR